MEIQDDQIHSLRTFNLMVPHWQAYGVRHDKTLAIKSPVNPPSHKHRRYYEVNPAIMAGPRREKQNTGKPSQSRRIPENPRGHGEEDALRGPNVQQSKPAKMTASPLANGYDLWSI